ncbi:glycosyltransferase [Cellulomonas sp.]|uniref:glycosyltransferase n=1 Tax=Cellulomonas sp. TaxID=40001 RepID=UPI001B0D6B1E|nr:glycosyltransferase [Cellulomonas sp.]MBO9555494.1 glycosyltransferase [Cellulomonas sp.]
MADARKPVLWLHSHFMLPLGGTKFIFEVTRRLAERRPVEVMVEGASPLWRERYGDAGVPLREIGGPNSTSMAYWAAFPAFLARDRRAVTQAAAGASALVSSFFPMPDVAAHAARTHGLRHVSLCFEPFPFFHDAEVIGMYPKPKQALLAFLRTAYGRVDTRGIQAADALLTLNEATSTQLRLTYGRDDAECTYAGVDTEFFRPYAPDEVGDLRARLGDAPRVVHSTDFSPIKRTDLAIDAFAVAARTVPGARLAITTTREDPPELERMMARARSLGVADQIDYLGFLPFVDLPRVYSVADVLLQTGTSAVSGATTMSLPVKEALACGTPVVRSGVTGEDVEDGVSGYLVDPTDSETTGARLAAVLGDRARAHEMGEAGRQRIARTYNWDRVVDVVERSLEAR